MEWRVIPGVVGRSAFSQFSAKDLGLAIGLPDDADYTWLSHSDFPQIGQNEEIFDSVDLAAISVRYELSKIGVLPPETAALDDDISRLVLYYALLSNDQAAWVRGGLRRISQIAGQFHLDDDVARRISGTEARWRYIWSTSPPNLDFAIDFGAILAAERFSAMLVLDLAVIGRNLATNSPKPLFIIDTSG